MKRRTPGLWAVPYLPIDPSDVGRTYESIIRINSQSGKGGVAYVLEKDFGFKLPKAMQPEVGKIIQAVTDREGRELLHSEIFTTFENEYLSLDKPYELDTFNVVKRHINKGEKRSQADVEATLLVQWQGNEDFGIRQWTSGCLLFGIEADNNRRFYTHQLSRTCFEWRVKCKSCRVY